MTKRRYRFLRALALLMIVVGVVGALIGTFVGLIIVIRPSLLLPAATTVDMRNIYTTTGIIIVGGSILGGVAMAAMGQFFQAFLELLEINRLQVKGLKALFDK